LNVVAWPPDPCIGTISFADANGNLIENAKTVQIAAGGQPQATFLDLPGSALVGALGQRAGVRPVVTQGGGSACIASVEVYSNITKATTVYWAPAPVSPSGVVY